MAFTLSQRKNITRIDKLAKAILEQGGTADTLVTEMHKYLPQGMKILRSQAFTEAEMDECAKTYNGFYTYITLMDFMVEGIQEGAVDVIETTKLLPSSYQKV